MNNAPQRITRIMSTDIDLTTRRSARSWQLLRLLFLRLSVVLSSIWRAISVWTPRLLKRRSSHTMTGRLTASTLTEGSGADSTRDLPIVGTSKPSGTERPQSTGFFPSSGNTFGAPVTSAPGFATSSATRARFVARGCGTRKRNNFSGNASARLATRSGMILRSSPAQFAMKTGPSSIASGKNGFAGSAEAAFAGASGSAASRSLRRGTSFGTNTSPKKTAWRLISRLASAFFRWIGSAVSRLTALTEPKRGKA